MAKITNNELANALRAAGVVPNGQPWKVAKEQIAAGASLEAAVAIAAADASGDELLKPKSVGCSDLACEHQRCAALRKWAASKGIVQAPAKGVKAGAKKGAAKKTAKKAAPKVTKAVTQEPDVDAIVAKLRERPEVAALLASLLA